MVPTPKAVRVKTSDGWQDVAIVGPQGPPSGQMVLIEDKIVTTPGPNLDFQNIPQTFAHLVLKIHGRSNHSATNEDVYLRLNNDSSTGPYNYSHIRMVSTVAGVEAYNQNAWRVGNVPAASAGAGYAGQVEVTINNYLSSLNKTFLSNSWMAQNDVAGNSILQIGGGVWRNNTLVNRVTAILGSGNWVVGTRATLYGIKASPEGLASPPAGSITTEMFAPTAKAPDADKVDGLDSLAFARSPVVLLNGAQGTGLPFNMTTAALPRAMTGCVVQVFGSIYASTAGQLAVELGWDGAWHGVYLRGYVDNAGVYSGLQRRTLVPAFMGVGSVAAGAHTINFRNAGAAQGDGGDWFSAILWGAG